LRFLYLAGLRPLCRLVASMKNFCGPSEQNCEILRCLWLGFRALQRTIILVMYKEFVRSVIMQVCKRI
jgi:hypothetical protein